MENAQFIKVRVSSETKARVQGVAQRQQVTESYWVRQTIDVALRLQAPEPLPECLPTAEPGQGRCFYVRLRPQDGLLLKARAAARGMRPATYLSVLGRAHLRNLAPLPQAELLALRQVMSEFGAMGRNLNQIARAVNAGQPVTVPGQNDVLKCCAFRRRCASTSRRY